MSLNEILWDESDRANGECVTSTKRSVDDVRTVGIGVLGGLVGPGV
jgi:hypothetical protein